MIFFTYMIPFKRDRLELVSVASKRLRLDATTRTRSDPPWDMHVLEKKGITSTVLPHFECLQFGLFLFFHFFKFTTQF